MKKWIVIAVVVVVLIAVWLWYRKMGAKSGTVQDVVQKVGDAAAAAGAGVAAT